MAPNMRSTSLEKLCQMKKIFDELACPIDKRLSWSKMSEALLRCGFKIKSYELEFLSLKMDQLSFNQFHSTIKEGVDRRKLLEKYKNDKSVFHRLSPEKRKAMVKEAVKDVYSEIKNHTEQENLERKLLRAVETFGPIILSDDNYEFLHWLKVSSPLFTPQAVGEVPTFEAWAFLHPHIIQHALVLGAHWFMNNHLNHGRFPRHKTKQEFSPVAVYIYDQYLEYFLANSTPHQINSVIWLGYTPLAMACAYGLVDKARVIIRNEHLEVNKATQKTANFRGQYVQKQEPSLIHAVLSGNTQLIEILAVHPDLAWNAMHSVRLSSEKSLRVTAIAQAMRDGDSNMVEAFIPFYSTIEWELDSYSLIRCNLCWRQQEIQAGNTQSAKEYLQIIKHLLDVPTLDWNKDKLLVSALALEDIEALVVIFKSPYLIYDLEAAKRCSPRRKTVIDCIRRVKAEHSMTGMNFSDAVDWLIACLNHIDGK